MSGTTGAEGFKNASQAGWRLRMGGTAKSIAKLDEIIEEEDGATGVDTRRMTVGYGYRDEKSARAQLWSKYKKHGLTKDKFGGDDPVFKMYSHAFSTKNIFAFVKAALPPLTWLPDYKLSSFLQDLISGLIVGASSVPLGFAHAQIAGVSPKIGLWTCLVPALIYAVLGSSKHMSQGTDATIALMTHGAISDYDDANKDQVSQMLALMVGIVLWIMGMFRIDAVIHYMSRPILSGYISACTLLVILGQLKFIVGATYSNSKYGFYTLGKFFYHFHEGRWVTFIASCVMLLILIAAAALKSRLQQTKEPAVGHRIGLAVLNAAPLIVVTIATFVTWLVYEDTSNVNYRLQIMNNKVELPDTGIKELVDRDLNEVISDLIPQAFTIALISYISSMTMSLGYARGRYEVSGAQELVAHGSASVLGSVFGAMTPSSGLSRTALACASGQQTQMGNAVSFATLFVILVSMEKAFIYMPFCSLACIVTVSSAFLFDYHTPRWLYKIKAFEDLYAWIFALVMTIALGPTYGLFLSLGLSLVLIIQRISLPRMTVLGQQGAMYTSLLDENAELLDGVVVISVVDALFFGNAGRFKDNVFNIVTDSKTVSVPTHAIVLDLESVTSMDSTGLTTLNELNMLLQQQDVVLLFANVNKIVYRFFKTSGLAAELKQHLHCNTPVDVVVQSALHFQTQKKVATSPDETDVEANPVGVADVQVETSQAKAADSLAPDNEKRA